MKSEVRFLTTAEGVRIAYSTAGSGPPLVVVPSWISHLELDHEELVGPSFFERLGRGRQLVRYDKRGMGLSQRQLGDYSLEAQVADLHALIETLGLRDVTLFGSSQGGVISIAYTVQRSDNVSRLILYGAYHSMPQQVRDTVKTVLPLLRTNWAGLGTAPILEMFVPDVTPELREFFKRYQREAANGEDAAAILDALAGYDVSALLPQINVPTLVLHRRDDVAVNVGQGRELASTIPQATLVVLEGKVHLPYWGETGPLLRAIGEFLGVTAEPVPGEPAFRTILFTDLVGHTEMMSRLGDERGRAVLREHEAITRDVLKQHGGAEIKTMGDGFMASFASVTRAVECAVALQRAFDARNRGEGADRGVGARHASPLRASDPGATSVEPLHVRVGLNAGEPIEEEGDLFGATVILASRIAAKAGAGEILVANAVRELCAGKGFLFSDRGEFVAKGFEDPVRVYEVRWRDG